MKKKNLIIILFCAAVLTAALCLLTKRFPAAFSSLFAVPFEQIADGLGALSMAGAIGNGAALALWIAISAIPVVAALRCERGRDTRWERLSLFALSAMLLFALYAMTNPLLFSHDGAAAGNTKAVKAAFGVAVWSFIVLFVVLRLIRLFRNGEREQLMGYLRTGLCVLGVLIAAVAAVTLVNGVAGLVTAAQTPGDPWAEAMSEFCGKPPEGLDRCVDALRLAAGLVPYLFDIVIIIRLWELLGIVPGGEQAEIVRYAGRVSGICCTALGVSATLTAALNVVQTALMPRLTNVSVNANFPVDSVVFVIMALLFSRLIVENKRLRDDDSLFI